MDTSRSDSLAKRRGRLERSALIAMTAFVALILVSIFLVRISGAVITSGYIIPVGDNIILQHPDGGRVSEIDVRNGSLVAPGETLLVLDGTRLEADRDRLARQQAEQSIYLARLRAALNGNTEFSPPVLRGRDGETGKYGDIVETQSEALKAERRAISVQVSRAYARATGADEARTALAAQIASSKDRAQLVDKEIAELQPLVDDQLIAQSRLTQLQREKLDIRQRQEALNEENARLVAEAKSARLEAESLKTQDTDRLWREIEEAESKLADTNVQLAEISTKIDRLVVKAPVEAHVHELSVQHEFTVIAPGATIAVLVPVDNALKVRARLSLQDGDDVYAGQAARLRFDSYQNLQSPELKGHVETISADRSVDPKTGLAYFTVDIQFEDDARSALDKLQPIPGTPVTVLIETKKRSIANYLLQPLMDAFRDTFAGP